MSTAIGLSSDTNAGASRRVLGWIVAFAIPLLFGSVWASNTPQNWGFFGSFVGFQLLFLLVVSTFTDIRSRKIYNLSTYPAFLIALATSIWASTTHHDAAFLGAISLGSALSGSLVCFFVVFLAYQMTGCGAGDVKLAMVIGAFLGWRLGLTAVGLSYIAAAMAAIGSTAWSIGPHRLLRAFGCAIVEALFPGRHQNAQSPDSQKMTSTIPMAPFFAVGTFLAFLELI